MENRKPQKQANLAQGEICRFYDPLYEIVIFRREGGSKLAYLEYVLAGGITGPAEFPFHDLVNCAEMNRLNFLRQTGLAWLVYPSATHTRFSHSLGCWVLAQRAKDNVWVHTSGHEFVQRLDDWLDRKELTNEFMLSLLFHDLGHFPFSHIIENNDQFQDVKHETVTCELLKGEGPNFEFFKNYFDTREHSNGSDLIKVSEVLTGLDVDVGIMCSLISLDFRHLQSEKAKRKENDVKVLAQLVSGLIDLDRLDHYRRDSYFIGVRVGEFNVNSLLNEMTIATSQSDGLPGGKIVLLDDGILQAFEVLFSKDQLVRKVFNNPNNVAYEAMLNHCLAKFLEANPAFKKNQILALTDDELFQTLLLSPDTGGAGIMRRIRNRQPFVLVGQYWVLSADYKNRKKLNEVRQEILGNSSAAGIKLSESDLLFRIPRKFGHDVPKGIHDWMNLDRIVNRKNQSLRLAENHSEFVRYLEKTAEMDNECFSVFASTNEVRDRVDKYLSNMDFLRKVG